MKSPIRINANELKKFTFRKKFDKTFRKLIIMFAIAIVSLVLTALASLYGIRTIYSRYYQLERIQGEIRIDIQALSKAYLWALSSTDGAIRNEQLEKAASKFDDFDTNLTAFKKLYNGSQNLSKISDDLAVVQEKGISLNNMFNTVEDKEIFAYFNDTLYPAIDVVAADFKAVSTEITSKGSQVYIMIIGIVVAALAITAVIILIVIQYLIDLKKKLSHAVVAPANELKDAAASMAEGSLHINITYDAQDELGELATDLDKSTTAMDMVITDLSETLERIADGDFTHGSEHPEYYIGDYAPILHALSDITGKMSSALGNVSESVSMVHSGASNMRDGAAGLAEGASDQAAAIEQLTATVQSVNDMTQNMTASANKGGKMILQVQEDMARGAEKMDQVTVAMANITEASKQIEEIAHAIEGISSQTQLLSLNASIEAARAGEAGRGFAVVAEEISKLASDSSAAAQNTQELINGTLREIDQGNSVVKETQEAMMNAQNSVNDVVSIIQETGDIAENQAHSMKEISDGIEQISNVIQDNTATAQESSAVSQELSEQSDALNQLVSQFKIS